MEAQRGLFIQQKKDQIVKNNLPCSGRSIFVGRAIFCCGRQTYWYNIPSSFKEININYTLKWTVQHSQTRHRVPLIIYTYFSINDNYAPAYHQTLDPALSWVASQFPSHLLFVITRCQIRGNKKRSCEKKLMKLSKKSLTLVTSVYNFKRVFRIEPCMIIFNYDVTFSIVVFMSLFLFL